MDTSSPSPKPEPRSVRGWFADMPRWKKLALLAATAILVTGAVMMVTGSGHTPAGSGTNSGLTTSLAAGGGAGNATIGAEEPAAKGVFRLGFSFLAGFCIGSFLRATLKVATIAVGFFLFATMALSYYGLVDVNWQGLDGLWNQFSGAIANEWGSFQSFMTGSLPAAGLAVAGLATGLKRH